MYNNIAFAGGGIHAITYLGCIKYLIEEKMNTNINNFMGSSAGCFACLMMMLNYTYEEIIELLKKYLLTNEVLQFSITNVSHLLSTYGMKNGNSTVSLIEKMLEFKSIDKDITFIDLIKLTGKNLIVTVSNITQNKLEYISVDTYPEMKVSTAIKMSTAIPILYIPVKYYNDLYVDSFIHDNFPIQYFDVVQNNTLGFDIQMDTSNNEMSSFSSYLKCLYTNILSNICDKKFVKHKHVCKVSIPSMFKNFDFMKMKFDLNEEKFNTLVNLGYNSMQRFVQESE